MNPYDAAYRLVEAIKNSEEVKELKEAQKVIKEDIMAKGMLIDYRRKAIVMNQKKMIGEEIPKDELDYYNELSNMVNFNMVTHKYLSAERELQHLISKIQKIILEAVGELHDDELTQWATDDLNLHDIFNESQVH